MAPAARTKSRPTTVVGYEVNDKGRAAEAWTAGDLLVITGATANDAPIWSKAAAGATEAHGIALQDEYAGRDGVSVGIHGEMSGFSGLTPGQALYPSATVAGGLDTTQPAGAVTRVRARTATSLRYNYV